MATQGEYRVGVDFNPSGNSTVNDIKKAAAELIDLIATIQLPKNDMTHLSEVARLRALASTAVEEGAMWAVKAATKREWE